MQAFVTLDRLTFRTPEGRTLFDNLTLAFGPERTALVGRNGAGKSTLLRLMLGELEPAAGAVARHGRIAVLRQNLKPTPDLSVADLLGVAEPLARLVRIEAGEGDETDFALADWTLPERLEAALAQAGLGGVALTRPATSLSGGQATRAGLAALQLAQADLVLLDEPTNNLDAEARAGVLRMLAGWKGGAVIASHDRELLRGVDRIVEISSLGAEVFGGGYDLYRERKAAAAAAAERELANAERDVQATTREAQVARERRARRDAAGRRFGASGSAPRIAVGMMARRAEASAGREGRLAERQADAAQAQLSEAQGRVERVRTLGIDVPATGLAAGKRVLRLEDAAFGFPGRPPLFAGVDLRMTGPRRVAVAGPNGSGKTSLLRMVMGELAPTEGLCELEVRAAMLDQRAALLRDHETLVEAFRRLHPEASDNAARAALARFLFRNTAAEVRAGALSGGERLRAALACTLGEQPPQLLVLDEPTNHLDLDSIEALETALAAYDGALLVVSHDPDFLDAIGIEEVLELG